jgi:hypothetical protein
VTLSLRVWIVAIGAALTLAGCSGGASPGSYSQRSPTSPASASCSADDLAISVGTTQGAAGTSYTTLIITNDGSAQCTLSGTPSAQPVIGAQHTSVGPLAKEMPMGARGGEVVLEPGDQANVVYGMATAANWPAEECDAKPADGVVIHFNSALLSFSDYAAMPIADVCTKIPSTIIAGVEEGAGE